MAYLIDISRAATHLDHVLEKPGPVVPAQEVAMVLAIHRLRRVVDAHQAGPPPGDSTVDQDRLLRESPAWTFNIKSWCFYFKKLLFLKLLFPLT